MSCIKDKHYVQNKMKLSEHSTFVFEFVNWHN